MRGDIRKKIDRQSEAGWNDYENIWDKFQRDSVYRSSQLGNGLGEYDIRRMCRWGLEAAGPRQTRSFRQRQQLMVYRWQMSREHAGGSGSNWRGISYHGRPTPEMFTRWDPASNKWIEYEPPGDVRVQWKAEWRPVENQSENAPL